MLQLPPENGATLFARVAGALRAAHLQGASFLAVTVFLAVTLLGTHTAEVIVDMRTTTGSATELFYAGEGQVYVQERKLALTTISDGRWHRYRVRIPNVPEITHLRIDPAPDTGEVTIDRVVVRTRHGKVTLVADVLRQAVVNTNKLVQRSSTGPLRYISQGEDPYVDLTLPEQAGRLSLPGGEIVGKGLRWAATAAAVGWLLELVVYLTLAKRSRFGRVDRGLSMVAMALSDDAVLPVSPRLVTVVAGILVAASLYVGLDLHQSSLGIWEHVYPSQPVYQPVDIGSPKWIRTDEWNVHTPWMLNQVWRGYPTVNPNVGGESAPLLATVPTNHPAALAQVKFYGFHLFDMETGFSWFWAYKTFALFTSFFWLTLVLTRGDIAVAAFGAAWIYTSSFTQWWFSSGFTDVLSSGAFTVTGAAYLLFGARRRSILGGAALCAYGIVNLALHLYPPLIIAVGYLGIFIIIGMLLEPGRLMQLRAHARWRFAAASVGLCLLGVALGSYAHDAWTTLTTMRDTVYPGRRFANSGGIPVIDLFIGFFESQRFTEAWFPFHPNGNACESSSFIFLAPLLFLALPSRAYFARENSLLASLFFYLMVLLAWTGIHLPAPFERAMQLAGWSQAPPGRVIAGIGVCSILLLSISLSRIRAKTLSTRAFAGTWVPLVVAGSVAAYGSALHTRDPLFFAWKTILTGTVMAFAFSLGATRGSLWFAMVGLCLSAVPTLSANPLVSGISAVSEKPILLEAKRLSGQDDKWVVLGDFFVAQGFKAHGLNVVNGSHYVPDKQLARVMDSANRFRDVWNRYAHVVVYSSPQNAEPEYNLHSPDLYVISLNVCGRELRELGVTRIAYTSPVPEEDLRCLEPLDTDVHVGIRLFRFR